jgi:hypothetical protein
MREVIAAVAGTRRREGKKMLGSVSFKAGGQSSTKRFSAKLG